MVVGGLLDGIDNAVDEATTAAGEGDLAGVLNAAAGSVDESVGRQFDDTPGGGFADEAADVAGDPAGAVGDAAQEAGEATARALVGAWLPDSPTGEFGTGGNGTPVLLALGVAAVAFVVMRETDIVGGS